MKKLLVYLTVGVLAISMTGCGNKNSKDQTGSVESSEATVESSETMETAPAQSENATEEMPEEEGGWSEEMQALRQAVVDALGENYWPDSQIPREMLEGTFGVTQDMYDDYMGEMPMISVNVDTLLIIKAKDGKVETVEDALNAYRDNEINQTMQYPMNLGKIQASKVAVIGNYVCFVQLGADSPEDGESSDEAVIQYCQQQNDFALQAIEQKIAQ